MVNKVTILLTSKIYQNQGQTMPKNCIFRPLYNLFKINVDLNIRLKLNV